MRRRRLLALAAAALGLMTLLALWPTPAPKAEVSLATYDRVHSGMTEAEVAALLGPPTADRTSRPTPADIPAMPCGPVSLGKLLDYAGDKGTVTVYYNADGHLYHAWADLRRPTHSEWLAHSLRRW